MGEQKNGGTSTFPDMWFGKILKVGLNTTAYLASALFIAGLRSKENFVRLSGQLCMYFLSSSFGKIIRAALLKLDISVNELILPSGGALASSGSRGI